MNKQSNVYTIIYIIVLVVVVGAALAFTSMSLRDKQQQNVEADRMRQVLASVHLTPEKGDVIATYEKIITEQLNVKAEDGSELPVYVADLDGAKKYIIPMHGAGLWGPIWGYIAIDDNGSTVYGAFFSHQGETPGLGAEIEKPAFSDKFIGKQLIKDGQFMPIEVVKAGQKPADDADYVDGVSGGTITSKGVGAMLDDCLRPYAPFLKSLKN